MKGWWGKKSRVRVQLRLDEFPDSFPDLSKHADSIGSISEVETISDMFQKYKSKSVHTISDTARSTGG